MQPDSIRVLIVDDEPLAREKLRLFLQECPDMQVVGECANGKEAIAALRKATPDVVFLDIQMPEVGGFDVIRRFAPEELPMIIFVTAYDDYAIDAFEIHALDYLLKPFDHERFQKTVERIRQQMARREPPGIASGLGELLQHIENKPRYLQRLLIKSGGGIYFLKVDEIDWIEAAGNYVNIHTGKKTHLLRESLSNLETRLNPARFVRIHRSQIVNVERIEKLQSDMHGEYLITIKTGEILQLSRTYRDRLLRHFEEEG